MYIDISQTTKMATFVNKEYHNCHGSVDNSFKRPSLMYNKPNYCLHVRL